jgi:thymidylate synthase (FAD)
LKISPIKVELLGYYGSDLDVVNAARVSFAKESDWEYEGLDRFRSQYDEKKLSEKDQKLINYLAKHSHWSPFAHNSLRFRIKAPVFCARQMVKHQVGGVWNEVSRRYVDDEPEFYFPEVFHGKPTNAKQGASDENMNDVKFMVDGNKEVADMHGKNLTYAALQLYSQMIHNGFAPEEARMFLPLNTMTEWWWTGSLMFFARVCKQRLDSHAQGATREVAAMINKNIPDVFQHSWKALMEGTT